jgi:hypothetical protein
MSYVEKNLISGEELIFQTGVHWSVLFWPVVGAILLASGGVALLLQKDMDFMYAGGILFVLAGAEIAFFAMKRNATEIAVTNRRVIIKTGFMSRQSLEIMLAKVESIGIDETAVGRMLGYGTMMIHGTGGTPEPFRKIAHPDEFRREVQEQIGRGK